LLKKITTFDQLIKSPQGSWIYFIFRGKFCIEPIKERSRLFRIARIYDDAVHLVSPMGKAMMQRDHMGEYETTGSSVYVIDNKIHVEFINLFEFGVNNEE